MRVEQAQSVGMHADVRVDEHENLTLGVFHPPVPGARGATVRVEGEESGIEPPGHGAPVIRGGVVDDDALVVQEP